MAEGNGFPLSPDGDGFDPPIGGWVAPDDQPVRYEATPYQQTPYQQTPYQQTSYQQTPYQQTSYQQTPYQQTPYEQAPYQWQAYPGGYEPAYIAESPFPDGYPPMAPSSSWLDPALPTAATSKGHRVRVLAAVAVGALVAVSSMAGLYLYGKSQADSAAERYEAAFSDWQTGQGAKLADTIGKGVPEGAFGKATLSKSTLALQKEACGQISMTRTLVDSPRSVPPKLAASAFAALSGEYSAAKKRAQRRTAAYDEFVVAASAAYKQLAVDCNWDSGLGAAMLPANKAVADFYELSDPTSEAEYRTYLRAYKDAFLGQADAYQHAMVGCDKTSAKPVCDLFAAVGTALEDDVQTALLALATGRDLDGVTSSVEKADRDLINELPKRFPGLSDVDSDNDSPSVVFAFVADKATEDVEKKLIALVS